MLNGLREENLIPTLLNFCNITTVPKTGSIVEPENERGIFGVPLVQSILMRLIYNEKFSTIDKNMSDCQMGAIRNGK